MNLEGRRESSNVEDRRGMSMGKKAGRLEGLREGREEGICEGRREGRQEKQMEIARTMLDCKFDISTIAKLTGLSEKEILVL